MFKNAFSRRRGEETVHLLVGHLLDAVDGIGVLGGGLRAGPSKNFLRQVVAHGGDGVDDRKKMVGESAWPMERSRAKSMAKARRP